jgi:hypothetical protein
VIKKIKFDMAHMRCGKEKGNLREGLFYSHMGSGSGVTDSLGLGSGTNYLLAVT